jgi:putative transposase
MQRFKSPEQAQHFLACFESIRGHFCPRRHLLAAAGSRTLLAAAFRSDAK